MLHVIFVYLYYIVKESLSGGLTELFFNCVFFIDKLFNTCVRFINTFVKHVRKLGYGRDICLVKICLAKSCTHNLFSNSACE